MNADCSGKYYLRLEKLLMIDSFCIFVVATYEATNGSTQSVKLS